MNILLPLLLPTCIVAIISWSSNRKYAFDERAIAIEHAPPDGLRSAEVALLLPELSYYSETFDIATLVDLAERGYLSIEELPPEARVRTSKGEARWKIKKLRDDETGLKPFEKSMFAIGFGGKSEMLLTHDPTMWPKKNSISASGSSDLMVLLTGMKTQGYFPGDSLGTGTVLIQNYFLATIMIGVFLLFLFWPVLVSLSLAGGVSLLFWAIGFIVAGAYAKRFPIWPSYLSDKGMEARCRALGFKKYVESVIGPRVDWTMRENINEKLLGYAIVFGLGKNWHEGFAKPVEEGVIKLP